MRMGSIPTSGRRAAPAVLTRYTDVLTAALSGGEEDVSQAVETLDKRDLSRLLNALRVIELITGRRETRIRRTGS